VEQIEHSVDSLVWTPCIIVEEWGQETGLSKVVKQSGPVSIENIERYGSDLVSHVMEAVVEKGVQPIDERSLPAHQIYKSRHVLGHCSCR
jgi:hypothetical protein